MSRRRAAGYNPRMPRILIVATISVLVALTAVPAAAQSGDVLARAVAGLRSNPVYVDSAAENARDVDVNRLRRRISGASGPIFVAVLPAAATEEAGGDANQVATELGRGLRRNGTYAAMAGDRFSAASSTLDAGRAGEIAVAARAAHPPDDVEAVLADFVDRVAAETGSPTAGNEAQPFEDGDGEGKGGGPNIALILVLLAAAGGGLYFWQRKRRNDEAAREVEEAEDRKLLEAELSVLADDVLSLEPQVALHPEAADDYQAAASRFQVAQAALASADDPIDLVRVRRVVDESRYAMSRARALVQGREPPPPPPDLARPGRRGEPAVDVDDDGRLGYVGYGGPFYGGGGWFGGGGGGLFTGLFLGQMLGGWGGGWGGGHDTNVYVEGDGGGDGGGHGGDGGDGGGDWGGGDFGGGDFGGGDFGGGDF